MSVLSPAPPLVARSVGFERLRAGFAVALRAWQDGGQGDPRAAGAMTAALLSLDDASPPRPIDTVPHLLSLPARAGGISLPDYRVNLDAPGLLADPTALDWAVAGLLSGAGVADVRVVEKLASTVICIEVISPCEAPDCEEVRLCRQLGELARMIGGYGLASGQAPDTRSLRVPHATASANQAAISGV